jgi:hypothetical protein
MELSETTFINDYDFLKFIIFLHSSLCNCLPQAPKSSLCHFIQSQKYNQMNKKAEASKHSSQLHGVSGTVFNPLPFLFKALLHGQKDCIFFSGHLIYILLYNKSALERLGRQGTFKSQALWSIRDGKGLNIPPTFQPRN